MTVVDIPSGARTGETWLGGRFRLDERISLDDQVSGFSGACVADLMTGRDPVIDVAPFSPARFA